jgi:hypothetical protein
MNRIAISPKKKSKEKRKKILFYFKNIKKIKSEAK